GQTILVLWVLFIGVAFLSIIFSFFRTIVRFYGFKLIDSGKKWNISYGLFDRSKKIIPISKIQILSWRANWVRRKFHFWTVQVPSLGHKENRKTNVLIPLTSFIQVIQLARSYQEFREIDYEQSNRIEPEIWRRKSLLRGIPITLLVMGIAFF